MTDLIWLLYCVALGGGCFLINIRIDSGNLASAVLSWVTLLGTIAAIFALTSRMVM